MKNGILLLVSLLLFTFAISSCKSRKSIEVPFTPTFSTLANDSVAVEVPREKREIFYGILTPVEVSNIFTRLGALYTPEVLNDVSNSGNYLSSSKAALNLGVYGVDLSYLKMFDLNAEMVQYMLSLRAMSSKLGIPAEYLTEPITRLESDMSDSDSVLVFVNESFKRIDDHLALSGQESTAGLMVLGGWIEALYISTQLLLDTDNPDPEVVERIAEQKYTLNTLLSFLKNYYDDPVVVYYTKKLKFLKKYFDKFDIYFQTNDLEIDRSRQVLKATGSEMTITQETLFDIKDYVSKMREETIGL
jgi:hypothetical protein